MGNALRNNALRAPRWIAALLLLAVSLLGVYRGWFEVCSVETTIDPAGDVLKRTCNEPDVTDAAVVGTALMIILLVIPDMSEVGVFGLSLKRRVEAAERQASHSSEKADKLEDRILIQGARIDSLNQNVAAAAAQASVGPILIGDTAIQHALSGLPRKKQAFEAGAPVQPADPAEEPVDATQVARLIRNWERIAASLDLPPYRYGRTMDLARIPIPVVDAARFSRVFSEELQIVRAARNTVAHAGTLPPEQLKSAVDISDRLLEILSRSGDH